MALEWGRSSELALGLDSEVESEMESAPVMALRLALESAPMLDSVMALASALGKAQDLAQGSDLATALEKELTSGRALELESVVLSEQG